MCHFLYAPPLALTIDLELKTTGWKCLHARIAAKHSIYLVRLLMKVHSARFRRWLCGKPRVDDFFRERLTGEANAQDKNVGVIREPCDASRRMNHTKGGAET